MNVRRFVAVIVIALGAAAALSATACTNDRQQIRIFAASSLQDVLPQLLDAYAATAEAKPNFVAQYGGSQALATQIELGAEVDLFIAANRLQAQRIVDLHLAQRSAVIATNHLVIAVPTDSEITSIDQLAERGVRVAIGAPEVPVGALTHVALDALDPAVSEAILANVVTEDPNVRVVLSRVELGEADAAFVYGTDLAEAEGVRAVELPAALQLPSNQYVGTIVDGARSGADDLLNFLLSDEARAILARAGFGAAE